MQNDAHLISETYEQVMINESIVPFIPLILNQLNNLHTTYSSSTGGGTVDPKEAVAIITACITLITLSLGGFTAVFLGKDIVNAIKTARHWILSKVTSIDVNELEEAASKAKAILKNPSEKGQITTWVNRLKAASDKKDSAGMHKAFEHLTELVK